MSKELKEKRTDIVNCFRAMPIAQWMEYINDNAKSSDEVAIYKEFAREALDFSTMEKYVKELDNKAKKEFAKNCYAPKYKRADVLDENGNPIYKKNKKGNLVKVREYVLDSNGNRIEISGKKTKSVMAVKPYFIEKYIPDIKASEKKISSKSDFIDEWLNLED